MNTSLTPHSPLLYTHALEVRAEGPRKGVAPTPQMCYVWLYVPSTYLDLFIVL